MSFTKTYFDSFEEELLRRFKTTGLTVTVRLTDGERYNLATITSRTDEVISYAFYGNKEGASSDQIPLPMLAVPYSAILAIEVKAAKATKAKTGFQFSTEQQKQ